MRTDARRLAKLVVFASACAALLALVDAVFGQVTLLSRSTIKARQKPHISVRNQTLANFLDIVAPKRTNTLVWLTLADFFYATAGTLHLDHFLSTLPLHKGRPHVLIVLCTDEGCRDTCEKERKYHCYCEYLYNRPAMIADTTWPKIRGLPDVLATGRDAMFVDSDVFFKANPLDKMAPLDSADLQIATEGREHYVNTGAHPSDLVQISCLWLNRAASGFFHVNPTPATIRHFEKIIELDMQAYSRDQAHTNTLLRTDTATSWNFTSPEGIRVQIIPHDVVYPFHDRTWDKTLSHIDSAGFHSTCGGDHTYKNLFAREYGYMNDFEGYYSNSPKILRLPALSGTPSEIRRQFTLLAEVAVATKRSMILPDFITVDLTKYGHGVLIRRPYEVLHYTVLHQYLRLPLLESDYIKHAIPHQTRPERISMAVTDSSESLLATNEVRCELFSNAEEVVTKLLAPNMAKRRVITLTGWNRMKGQVPEEYKQVFTCLHMEKEMSCNNWCRIPGIAYEDV